MKVVILLTLLQFSILAGNKVGNGGDGVKCGKALNLTLLDFYENERLNRFNLTSSKIEDEFELAKKVLGDYARLDAKYSKVFLKILDSMRTRSRYLMDTKLTNIEDSNELGLGKGCELVQLVIRKKDVLTGRDEFHFSKDDWDKLDTFNKAGLLIHEIVYEYFKLLGESDSQKARVLTSYLFSKEMRSHKQKDYHTLIRNLKVAMY